jgi:pyruvate/2-oxoglutarate dehydrogenase complex dihydrolipoamide acyltransferase (E2) component
MTGQSDKRSAIGEWVWRFIAFAMLLMLGYMAWVITLLNPPPLIMPAAFEASAKANAERNVAQKTTAEGMITPAKPAVTAAEAPKPAAEAPKPAEEAPKPAPAPAAPAKPTAEDVAMVVEDWARAWSARDADAYLAFYAPDFNVPGGEKREAWEKGRRQRITAPKSVAVSVEGAKVEFQGDGKASVSFRQQYKSDVLSAVTNKTLVLVLVDGRWRIQQETSGN